MWTKVAVWFFTLGTLTACAVGPQLNLNNPQEVAAAVTVNHDGFKKVTDYKGPNALSSSINHLFLRSWKPDGQVPRYQIYVVDYYAGQWRFYSSADDSNGNALDTTVIARDVDNCRGGTCLYSEHIAMNVSKEYLEGNQQSGIHFKVSGKAGEQVYYLPPAYIRGFLTVAR